MALEFLDRLRSGQFISPTGTTHDFKIDLLEQTGGKKGSSHEILNTNTAILQDQGNTVRTFPMNIYFTDGNQDLEAAAIVTAFEEHYTQSDPGVLKHPRWGDINVMPFTWSITEQLVKGAGITRITVEFKETPATDFPQPEGTNEQGVIYEIESLADSIEDAAAGIDDTDAGLYATFSANITDVINNVNGALDEIASKVDSVEDQFRAVQSDIQSALAAGDSAVQIISQVGQLIRLPGQITDATIAKVSGFADMFSSVVDGLMSSFRSSTSIGNGINTAITAELIGTQATAGIAEAAMFSDYTTREASGQAIDYLQTAREEYFIALGELTTGLSGNITQTFTPDVASQSGIAQIIADSYSVLISRSFDLKAKKSIILTAPSDPLTLTYKMYGSIDMLEYFLLTNRIAGVEFVEIPAGREIVAFV